MKVAEEDYGYLVGMLGGREEQLARILRGKSLHLV